MVLLSKIENNKMILTLTEKENGYVGEYYLNITNCQDLSEINNIYLYDVSTNPYRYNEFNVNIVSGTTTGSTYDSGTTMTTIYNLIPGFYDYVATDLSGTTILEIGKILVDRIDDTVIEGYSCPVTEYNAKYQPTIIEYKNNN